MKFQSAVEKRDPQFKAGFFQQTISSILSSSVATVFNTPFDVVKYRLQAQKSSIQTIDCFIIRKDLIKYVCPDKTVRFKELRFQGIFDAFFKIYRYEGFRGLYKDLLPKFICTIPANAVYYISYEEIRTYFNGGEFYDDAPVPIPVAVFAGSVAKTLDNLVSMPLEPHLHKVPHRHLLAAPQKNRPYTLKNIYSHLPVRLYRDIPFSAIYWPIYEYLKIYFEAPDPTLTFSFFAGVAAALVAAFFTTPLDLIKTIHKFERLVPTEQKQGNVKQRKIFKHGRSVLQSLRKVYQAHGITGCFAGAVPRLVKVAPSVGISVALFEVGNNFFYKLNETQYYKAHPPAKKPYKKKGKKKHFIKWHE